MTKLERMAREFVDSNECEVMDSNASHVGTFIAGANYERKRAEVLVEALKYLSKSGPFEEWPQAIAQYAIAQYESEE